MNRNFKRLERREKPTQPLHPQMKSEPQAQEHRVGQHPRTSRREEKIPDPILAYSDALSFAFEAFWSGGNISPSFLGRVSGRP